MVMRALIFLGLATSCAGFASEEKKEAESTTPAAKSEAPKADAHTEPPKADANAEPPKADAKSEPPKEAEKGGDGAKAGPTTVWKRRLLFPTLELDPLPKIESIRTAPSLAASPAPSSPSTAGELTPWNPKASRFTVVALLASWNPKSTALVPWLNGIAQGELARRKVRVLAAFSHDTAASVSRFVKETRPRFEVGLAPLPFVKNMGNPKVPTVWIVNNRGEIVTRKEMPSDAILDELRLKILDWTDF